MKVESFESWSRCDDCGFQGLLLYRTRTDEDYRDDTALGFMMDSSCPSCGQEQAVLVVAEEFRAMLRTAARGGSCR